ncbi:hypothetical protein [Marinibactrum halimedae]|uniref:Alpha/beta hydrolase n=1 Tax=Marinibactrum halimedae TaxID=1444977 RepID=A0AA37T8K9_9GAMM|nr:hypothetical protein [Marinibactrum halimedae]MCD9458816.1 hypothetical protein [Marinibactrum halimedae]GLS25375.1 hypothetical protein GCM10007877_10890 [Marinibactrum halimedae]
MNTITTKLAGSLLTVAFSCGVSAGTIVSERVGLGEVEYMAEWYLPDVESDIPALVYLQHGFGRGPNNLLDLATYLMDKGFMVLSVDANLAGGNPRLAARVVDQFTTAPPTPPNGYEMPEKFVAAGHSAGALNATLIAEGMVEADYDGYVGAILLDPVDADNLMEEAMQASISDGKPVYAILANVSPCNSFNNAEPLLSDLSGTTYVGLKLTNRSTHLDAEASNAGFWAPLACGRARSENITTLMEFTAAWAYDLATGQISSEYYPGGSEVEALIANDDAYLLK